LDELTEFQEAGVFGKHARTWWILGASTILVAALFSFVDFRSYPQAEWGHDTKQQFYFQDQGSKLLPVKWFQNLVRPEGEGKFADGLDRFGFIPPPDKFFGPYGLPIGFAIHKEKEADGRETEWIGLTCAACHTARVVMPDGKETVIDGGPALLDFDSFFTELVRSLTATLAATDRFNNFANAVSEDPTYLRTALQEKTNQYKQRLLYDTPDVKAGFGRVDAFGQIFNSIALKLGNPPERLRPPNAPASYPCLWDIPKHDRVQWNGSAPNLGVKRTGSILRNVGEVLGVFGEIKIAKASGGLPSYQNSANVANLKLIEEWLTTLPSPSFPGAIDKKLSKEGSEIYQERCQSCHAIVNRLNTPVPTPVKMIAADEIGTDPVHEESFRTRLLLMSQFAGRLTFANPREPWNRFAQEAFAKDATINVTLGAFLFSKPPKLPMVIDAFKGLIKGLPDQTELAKYKARPLNGAWATSPYLHNGSVLTLWQLLLPPTKRKETFCIGNARFDVKEIGYLDDCSGRYFVFDTRVDGNRRNGHTYGTDLDDPKKKALLEYLKTL
jgi:processive rubber oxygenase RoxA-like protein